MVRVERCSRRGMQRPRFPRVLTGALAIFRLLGFTNFMGIHSRSTCQTSLWPASALWLSVDLGFSRLLHTIPLGIAWTG